MRWLQVVEDGHMARLRHMVGVLQTALHAAGIVGDGRMLAAVQSVLSDAGPSRDSTAVHAAVGALWTPHATLLKLGRMKIKGPRPKITAAVYEPHRDAHFGSVIIPVRGVVWTPRRRCVLAAESTVFVTLPSARLILQSVQLLAMMERDKVSGFYKSYGDVVLDSAVLASIPASLVSAAAAATASAVVSGAVGAGSVGVPAAVADRSCEAATEGGDGSGLGGDGSDGGSSGGPGAGAAVAVAAASAPPLAGARGSAATPAGPGSGSGSGAGAGAGDPSVATSAEGASAGAGAGDVTNATHGDGTQPSAPKKSRRRYRPGAKKR
jgi:hypothetical protein